MSPSEFMLFDVDTHLKISHDLTAAEQGAVMLLFMSYWQSRSPLPLSMAKLAVMTRMSEDAFREAWDNGVKEFFEYTEDGLLPWCKSVLEMEV